MAEFLFEIGLEEMPARMIAGAEAELARRVAAMLERERLVAPGAAVKSFSTPRRLAVWVEEVAARQEDVAEEVLGPSAKIAYKDGVATAAAVAFAKKAGVAVEALKTVTTPKGEYLQATSLKAGRGAAEVIAAELPKALAGIYWAKNMYWRAGRPERFVRPVRWLLALLGGEVVPVAFAGYVAGRETFGHRVLHGAAPVLVTQPGEYAAALRKAYVEAEVETRRHTIRKALDRVCRTLPEMRWREDHALVDKLTHLTEWPTVIAGGFEPEYLTLPEEVLVTVMRDHQSYFAVEDKAGKLAPYFLAVLNTQADAAGEATIRHGNERVLRARFNDARFFWEFDQRISLGERVELLKAVTFQKELGSYYEKTIRIVNLCRSLESRSGIPAFSIGGVSALEVAAMHAKTDLTTELVKEFTDLQGIVGGLYAGSQRIPSIAADAIYDQYKPNSMEDSVPRSVQGSLLSIADRADTIARMFSLGLEPTGSKDPFALRRAANGIIKILAEAEPTLPLLLGDIIQAAAFDRTGLPKGMVVDENRAMTQEELLALDASSSALASKLRSFFAERLEFYLREARGQAYDVVKAVLAAGADEVRDAVARAEAVTAVRGASYTGSGDFAAVSAAFKRMKNILVQAAEKGVVAAGSVDWALLTEATELALAERSAELAERVAGLREQREYVVALTMIATLRPQVDAFFEAVMVMVPDVAVRANRLALLQTVLLDFSGIADFSEIVTQG